MTTSFESFSKYAILFKTSKIVIFIFKIKNNFTKSYVNNRKR